jgi:tRNA 2-selenouridine synthase
MIHRITIDESLQLKVPFADVRSPAEYAHGHIPGAASLPLFTDEERARVGTTYKQQGREAAILLGFELTGPKWAGFIRQAMEITPGKKIAVHCWRGGMRSAAMAWALDLYGFDVYTLKGGYKAWRRWVLDRMEQPYCLRILGGMTGSGKTKVLEKLKAAGEQVVDLEDLAQHQGSSYGTLNRLVQPTQEQFENNLALQLSLLDRDHPIWLEDESQNIGRCLLPKPFWMQMRSAFLFDLQVPLEQRVKSLTQEYGLLDKDFLIECTERIHKRLGPEQTKNAIAAITAGQMEEFIRLVLVYYDKTYRKGLTARDKEKIMPVPVNDTDAIRNASLLLSLAQTQESWISG